jgi:hypothetical protein
VVDAAEVSGVLAGGGQALVLERAVGLAGERGQPALLPLGERGVSGERGGDRLGAPVAGPGLPGRRDLAKARLPSHFT